MTALLGWGRCAGDSGWLRDAGEEESVVTGSKLVHCRLLLKATRRAPKVGSVLSPWGGKGGEPSLVHSSS